MVSSSGSSSLSTLAETPTTTHRQQNNKQTTTNSTANTHSLCKHTVETFSRRMFLSSRVFPTWRLDSNQVGRSLFLTAKSSTQSQSQDHTVTAARLCQSLKFRPHYSLTPVTVTLLINTKLFQNQQMNQLLHFFLSYTFIFKFITHIFSLSQAATTPPPRLLTPSSPLSLCDGVERCGPLSSSGHNVT